MFYLFKDGKCFFEAETRESLIEQAVTWFENSDLEEHGPGQYEHDCVIELTDENGDTVLEEKITIQSAPEYDNYNPAWDYRNSVL